MNTRTDLKSKFAPTPMHGAAYAVAIKVVGGIDAIGCRGAGQPAEAGGVVMGTKLRWARGQVDARLLHWCPGCNEVHGYRVEGDGGPKWVFNNNYDRPTFTPSMLITVIEHEDEDENPLPQPVQRTLCHYFIINGEIQYCGDSPHALAGKTVPLPDWPYAPGTYGGIEDE